MKTAIEILIEYIEEWQPKNKFTDPIWHKAKSLLETEKQQIIDAYETKIKTYINEDGNLDIKSGELFYKETFETNKETLK